MAMLDFKELPSDGVRFEQLIREMLIRSGFEVHWTGVGPDGGRDLVATERATGMLASFSRKWLVSCKHKAHGGGSVGLPDVIDIVDACGAVDAEGYLLACSTQPSSGVVKRLEELQRSGKILTTFWDGVEIEKRLNIPELFPLVHQFMPESAKAQPWKIYATQAPSVWAANYKDYFLYMSCRIGHSFPALTEVEAIAAKLESIALPGNGWTKHHLRLRAVFYDDKHEQFSVFVDYLYPKTDMKTVLSPSAIDAVLKTGRGLHSDGTGEWYQTHWDVRYVATDPYSDRFQVDSAEYYENSMSSFTVGSSREGWIDEIDDPNDPDNIFLEF
ncbi:hypothetical protein GGC65_004029 [Sphingopyxis sp. OAS728]|nr:hypothetical protein [Sphingopyxis sp. OAS728]